MVGVPVGIQVRNESSDASGLSCRMILLVTVLLVLETVSLLAL